ncbi:MAG TPA: DNA-directed RNA polymerase subunit omega [Bacteroidales bacterium]|nr:DNA-directed RNA polymerase subunit omega [Bacteroidales bacterium]
MELKKSKPEINTVTRDLREFARETGNIYQTVAIISKRSNQIALNVKEELSNKLDEFTSSTDNLEEVFENREQVEIAKHYEQLPKPTLVAIYEYQHGKIYYRIP